MKSLIHKGFNVYNEFPIDAEIRKEYTIWNQAVRALNPDDWINFVETIEDAIQDAHDNG